MTKSQEATVLVKQKRNQEMKIGDKDSDQLDELEYENGSIAYSLSDLAHLKITNQKSI